MTKHIWVNFDSDNGLLPNESSSELKLPYQQYGLTPFTYKDRSAEGPHERNHYNSFENYTLKII